MVGLFISCCVSNGCYKHKHSTQCIIFGNLCHLGKLPKQSECQAQIQRRVGGGVVGVGGSTLKEKGAQPYFFLHGLANLKRSGKQILYTCEH